LQSIHEHPLLRHRVLLNLRPFSKLQKAVEINRRVYVFLLQVTLMQDFKIDVVGPRGCLVVNPSLKNVAITNLMDGVDVFTLPNLVHLGTIKQDLHPSSNVILGIAFIGHNYLVSGGYSQIWISEVETLRVLSRLQGQETSK